MRTYLVTLMATALFVAGCAHRGGPPFYVQVDSLAGAASHDKRSYILLPGNDGVTWDDLQFQEYALYAMRALDSKGFVPASKAENADVAIVLSYGIGDPQTTQYAYSLPIWGQTGISSAHTYGTATAHGNTATYSGTTTYTPSYGVTGYSTHVGSRTSYFRYATLTGYDFEAFRKSAKQIQLWRTFIGSTGLGGDLRQVFPILIGAGAPLIATNTGKQVPVALYEGDNRVRLVKGELTPPAKASTSAVTTQQAVERISQLASGMTEDQVRDVMGEPVKTEFAQTKKAWHYCRTGRAVDEFAVVMFTDGKVNQARQYNLTSADLGGAVGDCSKFVRPAPF